MPPLHARIPTALARAIAWLSAFSGLAMLEMNSAWLTMLAMGSVVLGTVVAIPRLEKKAALLRIVGAAFPLCWGIALVAAGFLLDEPAWCVWVRLVGGTALLIISGGIALNADWGLRAGASLAWLQVLFQYGTVPMNASRIQIPAIRWTTAAGRIATCFLATVGATIVIIPVVCTLYGKGSLSSIPFAFSAFAPLLGIGLGLGLARECFRTRRQRIVADAAGFCILSWGQPRYVPYYDCAWGELRPTLWGVELVLRTPGFQQIVVYPLLDATSVLAAARALRRCARARGLGPQRAGRFISRPRGSSLLVWIRGIQDQVRGGPYSSRVPEAEALSRLLEDVTCPVDEKAAAAVALVTLGSKLRAEATPPLVTVAARLAGADIRMEQAIEFLDEEDRQEVRRSLGLSRPRRLA